MWCLHRKTLIDVTSPASLTSHFLQPKKKHKKVKSPISMPHASDLHRSCLSPSPLRRMPQKRGPVFGEHLEPTSHAYIPHTPKKNERMSLKRNHLEKEMSSSNHQFSGDMLVFGRVYIYTYEANATNWRVTPPGTLHRSESMEKKVRYPK